MSSNLGRRTARGAAWAVGGQGVTVVIGFLSTAILARLVSPDAFGMVAMVAAVMGFGELLRDFGLTNAVVQAKTVSRAQKSNLFWLNTMIGLVLTIIVFLLADPIASFFRNDYLISVVRVLSLTFLINGLSTQPRANMTRDVRMRDMAVIDAVSALAALIVAVLMGLNAMGVWALVGLQLARHGAGLVAAFVADRFIPDFPDRKVSIRPFVRFGVLTFAARIPVFLSTNIDSILIGRITGAQALGFYSRAYQLALLPTQQLASPLSRVMLPTLSRLRESPAQYNRALLRSQSIMTTMAAIGYSIAIVFASEIIRMALGPDWGQTVPLFQVLALAGMIDSAHNLTYWVFVSKGIPGQHLTYSLIGRPIMIVMIILAVPHGVMAVAWSYVGWIAVAWVFGVYWAGRTTDIPVRAMLRGGARTFGLCLTLIGAGLLTRDLVSEFSPWLNIATTLLVMIAVFGAINLSSPGIRQDTREAIGLGRHFTKLS